MNELKQKLQSLGLSEEMTQQAINIVADFAKSKLPENFHSMIDDALAGNTPDVGGLLGGIKSLFGK